MTDPVQRLSQMSSAFNAPQSTQIEKPPLEAPRELNGKIKAQFGSKVKEVGGRVVSGLKEEYKKSFALMGDIMATSASVSLPKAASGAEIGKFAFRLGLCPFKTGVGLLLSANLMLGMVLATPIMAAAKAFPAQTDFLFRSREKSEEGQIR